MKNKLLTLFLALAASVGTLFAQSGTCGTNLTWTFDTESGTLTISGTGTMTNHSYSWDSYRTSIKTVIIEEGVTSIENCAFQDCSSLTSVTIPNSVTSIGYCAFAGCSRLTSMTIPENVTSIGSYAFAGCISMTTMTWNAKNCSLGDMYENAYYGTGVAGKYEWFLDHITSFTFGDEVEVIPSHVCVHMKNVTSITIPEKVKIIYFDAFKYSGIKTIVWNAKSCYISGGNLFYANPTSEIGVFDMRKQIESITFGENVEHIPAYLCSGLSNLTSITIGNSVTSIGKEAFSGCRSLSSVNISNIAAWCKISFDSYNDNPLNYSHNLYLNGTLVTDLVIPDGVTSIGNYAFYGCSSLTSVTIPNSVTSIGEGAFYYCKISKIYFSGTMEEWCTKSFDPGSISSSYTLYINGEGVTNAVIPNSVTSIGYHAFRNCSSLTSITIPSSVTSIGEYAFWNCTSLTSVIIPNSVTSIGYAAFGYCSSLTSVTIPNSVTSIGNYAFSDCSSLTSLTIPNSVTSIGEQAFENCSSLMSVIIGENVTNFGESVFYGCRKLNSIIWNAKRCNDFVSNNTPFYSGTTYHGFDIRSQITSFVFGDNVEYIPAYLCCYMPLRNPVTIPNKVTGIGKYAFNKCTGLTSIIIPNSMTSIGEYAFNDCISLTSTIIPNSVTSIGNNAFCNVFNIVYHGDATGSPWGARSINGYVDGEFVYNDASKTKLLSCNPIVQYSTIIPNSVTTIGEEAFSHCTGLTFVTIGNSVTSIGNYAFQGCSRLTSITIPNSVTSIGDYAFDNCSSLKSVTMESATPPSVGISAFDRTIPIYVPLGSLKAYQETNWKNYNLRVYDTSYKTSAVCPTSAAITFSVSLKGEDKNKYIAACGMEEGEEFSGNTAEYIGLEPGSQYADVPFYIRTTKGDIQTITATFSTSALTLTTLASKAVSANTAILLAETNMSDAETSCGFEWRRNDQPEDMASNQVLCPVANGLLAGRLKGLRDDTYYKYRAFYKSAAGNMYYGDWQYIFTGDVAVEFDPVLYTYAAQFVSDRKATLKGYALPGADDFTEQGFEYWAESRRTNAPARRAPQYAIGEKHTVTGTGISMHVTLEDLDEGTVYKYRTYAKVGGKTLYGTEMSFTTEGEWIEYTLTANSDDAAAGSVTGSGTYHTGTEVSIEAVPATGYRFVEWSDGNTDNPRTVVLTEDMTITALFERLPDALGETQSDNLHNARKYILNGILYIERNGNTYTVQGQRID